MITGTLCRCGHLLECCADCRDWLSDNLESIENDWRLWVGWVWSLEQYRDAAYPADQIELDNIDTYELGL